MAIVILNYNGRVLLEKYLPSFEAARAKSRFACELWILDNNSSDGSVAFVRHQFPDVRIFEAPKNRVLCSYNDAARVMSQDVLIFMNSDIRADENFIDPLVVPFLRGEDVFFVTSKCLSMKNNAYEGNKTKAGIRHGVFWATSRYPGHELEIDIPSFTFQGGFGAFSREKFLMLGGYDDLYLPGRMEDSDICLRAQRRGWKCLYEPMSILWHEGGSSFHKEFGVQKTEVINWRNTFLFMLKNLQIGTWFLIFFFWLPVWCVRGFFRGRPEFMLGFISALRYFPKAMRRRRADRNSRLQAKVSDREIFKNCINPLGVLS